MLQFSYNEKKFFSSILAQWMGDEKWLTCIEIKSWCYSDQMRLKSLQIVQFECPGHCNPSHYTTLRVIDLSVEDHIQSWFRSKFFQIVQFEYSFHYNIAFLIQIWIIDLHWYCIYWGQHWAIYFKNLFKSYSCCTGLSPTNFRTYHVTIWLKSEYKTDYFL